MQRVFGFSACIAAFAATALPACATSQVPQPPIASFGDYQCNIDETAGVTSSAESYDLDRAPAAFVFSAYESPVTPEELRKGPLRGLDRDLSGETDRYEPEPRRMFSASITPDIFAAPAQALRSADLHVFHQDGVTIAFEKDLSFIAYGPAAEGGVAVYAGSCRAPQQ
ncbi:hypothetical protein [Hyphococcus luteus]|uniref:Uncharacterized protein n=1 Tax=Hyphococcus luteus TaxID=2058213 RepID=A0A2S7JZ53_9PROT|nr:hypothetical protein [Marinicaulis flavus]PQA85531.1 hypothetical protein CW354_21565 [Marinicaulis flavus]